MALKAVSEVFPLERFRWAMIPSSKQHTDVNGKHTQALGWVTVRAASGGRAPPCPPVAPLCCLGPARVPGPEPGADPGGRARVPAGRRDRQRKPGGAGRPRRGDSAARSTGLRPVFPVRLPPPRVSGVWAWAGAAGRRQPWTGGAAAAGGGTPKEGARRPPRAAATASPLPSSSLPHPSSSLPSPAHLGARPAPAAGARPGVAAPPPPAPRRKSPGSAGAATADPDLASASSPAPASAPHSNSTAQSLPAPGQGKAQPQRRGASGISAPAAGRPLSRRVFPAGYPLPEPALPAASLPPGRCGAPRHPLSTAAGASAPCPGGRAAATSCPASPSPSFVCFGFYRLSPALLRRALPPLSAGVGPAASPRSPPGRFRARRAPGRREQPGSPGDRLFSNGIKRLSVTFSVISTFRESAILRGKWERCHRPVGVFVYPGYSPGQRGELGGAGPPASPRPRRRGLGLPLLHREFLKSLCWHIPSGFQPCLGLWLTGSGEVSS